METQIQNVEINKLALRYGLLLGAISVVLSVGLYMYNPMIVYTNYFIGILSFILTIALVVIFALEIRKKAGGYWSFGEAFKCLIIMSLFASLFTVVYSFILFKYIDHDMAKKVADALGEVTSSRLSSAGLDQAKIDQYMKPFENGEIEAKFAPTLKNEVTNFGFGLLFFAVIDLIIAAIIKKRKPLYSYDPAA